MIQLQNTEHSPHYDAGLETGLVVRHVYPVNGSIETIKSDRLRANVDTESHSQGASAGGDVRSAAGGGVRTPVWFRGGPSPQISFH